MDLPFPDKPRVAIIGAGALGGYFGLRLALAGSDVAFLMRSDAAAVREKGLRVEMADGEMHDLPQPQVFEDVREIGACDLVLIALKATNNGLLKDFLPPLLHERTCLLTVQNGMGNTDFLREHFPGQPVVAGLCQIGVNRVRAGFIRNSVPSGGFLLLAAADEATPPALPEAVAACLRSAGIDTRLAASLEDALWRKLMWNVPFNGLTILTGGTGGTETVLQKETLRAYARALMEEVRLAAGAVGTRIEPEYTDKLLAFSDKLGPYEPSSLVDFRAGRAVEVEAIFGEPLRQGEAAGVEMPFLRSLYWLLKGIADPPLASADR
jgi:2-dehydropantoate 2-reductase